MQRDSTWRRRLHYICFALHYLIWWHLLHYWSNIFNKEWKIRLSFPRCFHIRLVCWNQLYFRRWKKWVPYRNIFHKSICYRLDNEILLQHWLQSFRLHRRIRQLIKWFSWRRYGWSLGDARFDLCYHYLRILLLWMVTSRLCQGILLVQEWMLLALWLGRQR